MENNIRSLGLWDEYNQACLELGQDLNEICSEGEYELERGHCGRCSQPYEITKATSTSELPAIAYGLRFDHGADL